MVINTIALAETMTSELDHAVVQKSCTGFLSDNSMQIKFVGTGKVQIPSVDFSGLGDYDRDTGFARGAISVSNVAYDLTMDRARSFLLDAQDCDETGIAGLSGQIMGEFVRAKVVPEMDAYVIAKLAQTAESNGFIKVAAIPTKAYDEFVNVCNFTYDKVGYDEKLVAFVNSDFWRALQSTPEISRTMSLSDNSGDIFGGIHSINGVEIIPVPDSRMRSEYLFYDGKTNIDGGFAADPESDRIGLLVLPKRSASLVRKTEKVRIFNPDQNQQADAWKFDYRIYYDLFVKNSMKAGVSVFFIKV